jgi:hypothetical protein
MTVASVNFQAEASRQGKIGEDLAEIRLIDAGFTIIELKAKLPGVEVDIIAENQNGIAFFFSVKASWRGDRQGLKRTDTLRKAIGEALLIKLNTGNPAIIITSHKPTKGTGKEALDLIPKDILFDVIELHNDSKRLKWLAKATERDLDYEIYPIKRNKQYRMTL